MSLKRKPSCFIENPWDLPFWSLASAPVDRTRPLAVPSPPKPTTSREERPIKRSNEHQDARALADRATSLHELREAVENFEGCALKSDAQNTVFSDGNPAAPIMLLGEAPGAEEDRLGKPFVGRSGQLLDRMFEALGWYRNEHLYISNTTYWRPPHNRDPLPQELEACAPFVEKHIALINPKVLVTVGNVATKFILKNTQGIMRVRGQWYTYQNEWMKEPVPVRPLYHPAYLLRSPGQKKWAWEDLQAIKAWSDEHGLFEA